MKLNIWERRTLPFAVLWIVGMWLALVARYADPVLGDLFTILAIISITWGAAGGWGVVTEAGLSGNRD